VPERPPAAIAGAIPPACRGEAGRSSDAPDGLTATTVMSSERRRAPRIEILGRLHGHSVSLDVPVTVREVSLGGMSIVTTFSFPKDAIHEFRLMMGDGSGVLLRGRVRYSREDVAPDGSRIYITGLQFVDDEPAEGESSVGDLLDRIK
jgi:PilZ domain